MSDHDLSLRGLSTEFARQASHLQGQLWNHILSDRALSICSLYCRRVKERWGIDLNPVVNWNDITKAVTMDVTPKTELDQAMLERLKKQEGIE